MFQSPQLRQCKTLAENFKMQYPYLEINFKGSSSKSFIKFWSSFIILGTKDHYYSDRINKKHFNRNDIERFYEWKNGMQTNNHFQKNISVQKIKSRLSVINQLKADFSLVEFNSSFKDISPIWQIFLLHLIRPTEYPIFDQHVFRAHYFLNHQVIREISKNRKEIIDYYHHEYVPFFFKVSKGIDEPRNVDQALVALGQFLSTKFSKI